MCGLTYRYLFSRCGRSATDAALLVLGVWAGNVVMGRRHSCAFVQCWSLIRSGHPKLRIRGDVTDSWDRKGALLARLTRTNWLRPRDDYLLSRIRSCWCSFEPGVDGARGSRNLLSKRLDLRFAPPGSSTLSLVSLPQTGDSRRFTMDSRWTHAGFTGPRGGPLGMLARWGGLVCSPTSVLGMKIFQTEKPLSRGYR